jgi:hypothetical protein
MLTHNPAFRDECQAYEVDMGGGAAFSTVVNKSKGHTTALRTDMHLTRTYQKAIDELRRLTGGNLLLENKNYQNEPESSAITLIESTNGASEFSTGTVENMLR